MSSAGPARPSGRSAPSRTVPLALVALTVALAVLTVAVAIGRPLSPAAVNEQLDVAILTASVLVAAAVSALDWGRYGETHEPASVLRASAFAVLAVHNLVTLTVTILGADARLGLALSDPGQLPIFVSAVGRGMAAMLLIAAGLAAIRPRMPGLSPLATVLAPAGLLLALIGAGALAQESLPPLVGPLLLDDLAADPTAAPSLGDAPALLVVQTLIGVGFMASAALAYAAHRRSGRLSDGLLAGGLLLAAFSQVHGAIHPGAYTGLVTTADVLRLGFYGLLLLGVVADSTQDLAELRAATLEIRRLASDRYVAAGLQERARLAREIHDGLAQDLWYAKLKHTRLAQISALDAEAAQLSGEVADALDAALAEARNAVGALREGAEAGPLVQMVERHVADFADRFAIRAEFNAEGRSPALDARAKAEVLRIVQEALTNVRKHADATMVRVTVRADGDLRLMIADNGRGFRTDEAARGFGLDSMRERAAVLGAKLDVNSEPQGGTRIELVVPVGQDGRGTHGR